MCLRAVGILPFQGEADVNNQSSKVDRQDQHRVFVPFLLFAASCFREARAIRLPWQGLLVCRG